MLLRNCKVLLVFLLGLYFAVFAFGNITAPGMNQDFVAHVMSMDTISDKAALGYRAITNEVAHGIVFWMIILWQLVTAVLLFLGCFALWGERDSGAAFQQAKGVAFLGLTAGLSLYFFVFVIVGGEWFASWQSATYNAQQASYRILAIAAFIFLILLHRDDQAGDF